MNETQENQTATASFAFFRANMYIQPTNFFRLIENSIGENMIRSTLALLVVLLVGLGCDSGVPASPTPELYERLGGQEVVTASVESFYSMLKADPVMWRTFEGVFTDESGTRANRFKEMMRGLICYMADGGCWYVGLSMHVAHSHMDISETEFDAMMTHLDRALQVNNVSQTERGEMISLFNEMKSDIVN